MASEPQDGGPCVNTDRHLWPDVSEPNAEHESIHVTAHGFIGINVGGYVYEKPLREWHKLAGGKEAMQPAREVVTSNLESLFARLRADGGRYLLSVGLTPEETANAEKPTFGGKATRRWLTDDEYSALCALGSVHETSAPRCAECGHEIRADADAHGYMCPCGHYTRLRQLPSETEVPHTAHCVNRIEDIGCDCGSGHKPDCQLATAVCTCGADAPASPVKSNCNSSASTDDGAPPSRTHPTSSVECPKCDDGLCWILGCQLPRGHAGFCKVPQ